MSGFVAHRWVGSDVSKAQLDVAVLPDDTTFRVRNDTAGWQELLARLGAATSTGIVLEATGGYPTTSG